jgi:serine protease Do
MSKRISFILAGVAMLALAALPGTLRAQQAEALRGRLAEAQALGHAFGDGETQFLLAEDDQGWLGIGIDEVTADKAKELKLSAERGVLVTEVEADSPAAKAGLKANDVITEYNGQRVEGTTQFRRLVRETPAGRPAQITVWRDGRAQSLTAQLGDMSENVRTRIRAITPKDFNFRFDMPQINVFGMSSNRPMLGIGAEDLSGQLGSYFGAPDGEGILVREVNTGSPAEKAGIKAGDVITKIDGERVRTTADLREKLRDKREKKTVAVGVIRKGGEVSLNVEIEQPKPAERKKVITRRLSI